MHSSVLGLGFTDSALGRMYPEDPKEAVKQCELLLEEPELEGTLKLQILFGGW